MYIIGIDGGGTSTQGKLSNGLFEIMAVAETGATNYHNVGRETAKARLGELLSDLCQKQNIDLDQVDGICFGGAGVDTEADREIIKTLFKELGCECELMIVNDAVTALAGGNSSTTGAVLISGTGSIIYAKIGDRQARCGGWGQLIDDGGSGYALGLAALKGIMESYDLRRKPTKLWQVVKEQLGVQNEEDIIHFLYHPQTGKERIAAIAPLVIQLAGEDELASEILDSGIRELVRLVSGLIAQVGVKEFSLALAGSLLIKSEIYRNAFIKAMHQAHPNVEIHLPYEGPVEGALRIIEEQLRRREIHA